MVGEESASQLGCGPAFVASRSKTRLDAHRPFSGHTGPTVLIWGPPYVTHLLHCFAAGYVYSSNAVVDLLSRGQPPTPSEASGEVRPRRESSFWQVSESDLGGRSQQTLSVPLGKTTVALTAPRPWHMY
jgi:hypothetical protein